jgi:hypothetical protein
MKSKLRIIVSGLIAQYPIGGVTWDYLQYVVGLAQLGHDVYYVEDTGLWPYNPIEGGVSRNCTYNVNILNDAMSRFGLADKWAYYFPGESRWYGLTKEQLNKIVHSSDLLINVSCSLQNLADYRAVKKLAYVDTDPVFTQLKLARGQADFRQQVDAHDVHFSYGECLAEVGPPTGHKWLPMRKPILISEWRPSSPYRDTFTTVMNWTSYKPIVYNGKTYGQKDVEFQHFLDLPSRVGPTNLELAVNAAGKTKRTPSGLLARKNWRVVDPMKVCPDLDSYRSYIESSKAEWTVAKNGYVIGKSGWFSGRTACYLAAGRPVVVQDTGFGTIFPVGEGILTFQTFEEAVEGIRKVEMEYSLHAKAALAIAEEYFDSDKVLNGLISKALN